MKVSLFYFNPSILGIPTTILDNLAAETCAYMNLIHPDYSRLAARIAVNNLHKMTSNSFAETIKILYNYKVFFITETYFIGQS